MYTDLIAAATLLIITAIIAIVFFVSYAHLVSSQSKHKPLKKEEYRSERRRHKKLYSGKRNKRY